MPYYFKATKQDEKEYAMKLYARRWNKKKQQSTELGKEC